MVLGSVFKYPPRQKLDGIDRPLKGNKETRIKKDCGVRPSDGSWIWVLTPAIPTEN